MAKKIIDNTPLNDFYNDWGGTNESGKEWGKSHQVVEEAIKDKMQSVEDGIGGKVAGVIVNGQEVQKDEEGKVRIPVPTVDPSLSEESANAVQNAAVAKEINELWDKAIGEAHTEAVEGDVNMINLVFNNRNGENIVTVPIPSGGSTGSSSYPKVTTNLLTPTRIKLGGTIRIEWSYDHIIVEDGESRSSGVAAQSIVVSVMIGTTQIYTESYTEVACGTSRTLVLNPEVINQAGTVNIYVRATTIYNDQEQRTQGFKSVTVIAMSLAAPSYNPAEWLAQGGYNENQSTVSIRCQHSVPSNSTLHIFLDGEEHTNNTISGAGIKNVLIPLQGLEPGGHNIRLVAESDGLLSNALSLDFLKAGGQDNYIGTSVSFDVDGIDDVTSSPIPLALEQFGELELPIGAWNASSATSVVTLSVGGDVVQTITVPRTQQVIRQRIDTLGEVSVGIANGTASLPFIVSVYSDVDVDETETTGYIMKLEAEGRSNSEAHPDDWGGITTFQGVDWASNGWIRGTDGVTALTLTNGAKAVVDIKPFVAEGGYSIQNSGMTFEFEFMISQVTHRGATVISCLYDNDGNGYPMGIKVTTAEASLLFGGVDEIHTAEKDEHGDPIIIRRPRGIPMNIAVDRWVHVAFVVDRASQGQGVAKMYINGVLSRANIYISGLVQNVPQPITFDSDKADIRVRGIRYYRSSLTSDEVLANHVIGRPTPLAIQQLHIKNAVTGDGTDAEGNKNIDFDKLREKGRGVLTIIRSDDSGDGLADLFASTRKDDNFRADVVRWEPPSDANGSKIGDGFEAKNIRIRIQGTSSVKYPYKNIRFYLATAYDDEHYPMELYIGGVNVTKDKKKGYPLRGSSKSIGQAVLCAKTDFVDSSLTLNTGGAHLFHDTMNALSLRTPPQEYDPRVRQAIDGIPCDVYAATSETGELTYYGQFVLNNEKSKSGKIFGMDGVSGFEPSCPISFEALINNSPITLFQPAGRANSQELEDQLEAEFDNGFEFNFPEDVWYSRARAIAEMKEDFTEENVATTGQHDAIHALFGWIYECMEDAKGVKDGTMTIAEPDYGDRNGWSDESKAKWVSQKFKDEASRHFNVNHLLTYYLFTDYWASVDQRAKNILWRTWDGEIWYATYYDGDTAQSIRNDAFMVYLYDVTRDTYDYERSKYAFEGHNSWLWCLVLANFETELKGCAGTLRGRLSTADMLNEFNGVMMGNWSERQYNASGKLKYIDTISRMNYVYTLTGTRELHRTQFITDRNKLLDARYGAGSYGDDVMDFTVVRNEADRVSSLTIVSNDLYYFGYKTSSQWLQGPTICKADESLSLTFHGTLATNDPLKLGGASCIKELDMTDLGSQLNGKINFSKCTAMERLVMPNNGLGNFSGDDMTFGDTSKLQYVDFTNQASINGVIDLSKHTRLGTFKASGTSLTRVVLADGAPVTTLELPSTLTTLVLRYFPLLDMEGLVLEDRNSVTALNMAGCPNLSWMDILDRCPNIRRVRIEGMNGIIRSERMRVFMSGYTGFDENGNERETPAFTGTVRLADYVEDFDTMEAFFRDCGLTLLPNEYTDYWFDDLVTDPANITNEDNKTGYAYLDTEIEDMEEQPNKYRVSGHVKLLHDLCWPVAGKIDVRTNKMTITRLSKSSFLQTESGAAFNPSDPNGEGYDIFLYIPRYWYKGVNDYKNSRKHFFLSALDNEPASTAANIQRYTLSETLFANGKAVDNRIFSQGEEFDENLLSSAATCDTHRVNVAGMKQVRFPSINNPNFSCAFVGADGTILAIHALDLTNAGTDFMDAQGDYDFRTVPENAELLYFTCLASVDQSLEVIAVDSDQTEAIEPDWVEHLPELVGIYGGSVPGITEGGTVSAGAYGLRSISGKATSRGNGTRTTNTQWTYDDEGNPTANIPATQINGTAQDFFNLARKRGNGYTTVTYETSKNIANLFMAWFGTRDVESKVGAGGTASYTTGVRNSYAYADTDVNTLPLPNASNTSQLNKIWGIEGWTGSVAEFTDNIVLNALSFRAFIRNFRRPNYTWAVDDFFNVVMQDDSERRVKTIGSNSVLNVEKVRFGRFCDIIASRYSQNTSYTTCYAASSVAYGGQGRIVTRGDSNASISSGVANNVAGELSTYSHPSYGARLCYFGEIVFSD